MPVLPSPQSAAQVKPAAWSATEGSVALRVKASGWLVTPLVRPETASACGTLVTFKLMVSVALRLGTPLSVARTVRGVEPAGTSPGVQVKTPVAGSMAAPAGAPAPRLMSVDDQI